MNDKALGLCLAALLLQACSNSDPSIRFEKSAERVAENVGTYQAGLIIDPASASDFEIAVQVVEPATTADGNDVNGFSPVVRVERGATRATLAFPIRLDAVDEADERIVVRLLPIGGIEIGEPSEFTLTIHDLPRVRFAEAQSAQPENGGARTVQVQLSTPSQQSITVPFTVTGSADRTADFAVSPSPLVIPAGQTSGTITVTPTNDATDDEAETVILTLATPANATLGTPAAHTLTIVDDDETSTGPSATFASATSRADETAGSAAVVLELTQASSSEVRVPFTLSGSATPGTDYTEPASPVVFPAGTTSQTIQIPLLNDAGAEPDETVILTLGTPTGAAAGPQTTHTLTIDDDETGAAPQGTLFVITDEYRLLRFQAADPATTTAVDVTGVEATGAGGAAPIPLALDFRPATGELYLYTGDRRFYVINPVTGVATLRGTTPAGQPADLPAMDFNTCVDLIRVAGRSSPTRVDRNLRLNPDGTLAGQDVDFAFAAGDPNAGAEPRIDGLAHAACGPNGPPVFALDSTLDALLRVGDPGERASANGGRLTTIGPFGVSLGGASQVPFDIDTVATVGYTANVEANETTTLYRINLLNGALTSMGTIVDGVRAVRVAGLAVQP